MHTHLYPFEFVLSLTNQPNKQTNQPTNQPANHPLTHPPNSQFPHFPFSLASTYSSYSTSEYIQKRVVYINRSYRAMKITEGPEGYSEGEWWWWRKNLYKYIVRSYIQLYIRSFDIFLYSFSYIPPYRTYIHLYMYIMYILHKTFTLINTIASITVTPKRERVRSNTHNHHFFYYTSIFHFENVFEISISFFFIFTWHFNFSSLQHLPDLAVSSDAVSILLESAKGWLRLRWSVCGVVVRRINTFHLYWNVPL